ncbi:hypothetical protein DVA67_014255 [Solirubrobacter sp. CPCC 204708]|uniref:Uncharacterized protein n=1 Tax=Solirubrobacter deserti TaxID=2282478 RepID=A0ABT4RBR1_9ACTN|nr:hypothetical protein [Solirubrobacter deserti]MBE2317140.1 hypothetical protein [Solirubrobacter deserti]MDA0135967.1 hypothetical protein [Solirubrobacter deserti]
MTMGRGIALVGGGLLLFLALLAGLVYFTRDEDNFQSDNLLAEQFTLEVARLSQEGGGELSLRSFANFPWDRGLLVLPDTPREEISRRLGQEWTGIDTVDRDLLIFVRRGEVVRFFDYRGLARFEGFQRPIDDLPDVLRIEPGLVVRPG